MKTFAYTRLQAAVILFMTVPLLAVAAGGSEISFDPKGPVARGKPYRAEADGAQIIIPDGWVYREEEHGLILGSDSEPGLIVVWIARVDTPEAVEREMSEALAGTGGRFGPLEHRQKIRLNAGEGIIAEASGMDGQGVAVRARLAAMKGKGFSVFVAGLTTNELEKMGSIRSRVDSMIRSVSFFAVDRSRSANLVAGQWWSYSGASGTSGGGGSERTLAFCPDGRYFESSESGYYGSGWGTASSGSSAGRWTASGTERSGTVRVTFQDGSSREYSYEGKGPDDLKFNNREFGRVAASFCR